MNLPLTGRCQCGALSYKAASVPLFTASCHCGACQHTSGSAYVSILNVPEAALEISGDLRIARRTGDSGGEVQTLFCAACGSRMFTRLDLLPERINIMAASLDDSSWYRPAMNIYAARAPAWHRVDTSIPTFEGPPPMPAAS